jgi:hypothetical protein
VKGTVQSEGILHSQMTIYCSTKKLQIRSVSLACGRQYAWSVCVIRMSGQDERSDKTGSLGNRLAGIEGDDGLCHAPDPIGRTNTSRPASSRPVSEHLMMCRGDSAPFNVIIGGELRLRKSQYQCRGPVYDGGAKRQRDMVKTKRLGPPTEALGYSRHPPRISKGNIVARISNRLSN